MVMAMVMVMAGRAWDEDHRRRMARVAELQGRHDKQAGDTAGEGWTDEEGQEDDEEEEEEDEDDDDDDRAGSGMSYHIKCYCCCGVGAGFCPGFFFVAVDLCWFMFLGLFLFRVARGFVFWRWVVSV